MAILQISQVMLVDLYPAKSASVTANVSNSTLNFSKSGISNIMLMLGYQNNLCRCILSAIGTAVIDPMRRAVGMGWTLVCVVN